MATKQLTKEKALFIKSVVWTLTLFGTAVGAGILFLPIEAGTSGIIPVFIMAALIGPIVFLAHASLGNVGIASTDQRADVSESSDFLLGGVEGLTVSIVYIASIFPMLLIYSTGLTNTVQSFLVDHNVTMNHGLVATIVVIFMMGVVALPKKKLVAATGVFVWPLLFILIFLMFYLMRFWSTANLYGPKTTGGMLKALWFMLPILIFSFNHLSAISACVKDGVHAFGAITGRRFFRRVEVLTVVLLVVFSMGFTVSVLLSLTPERVLAAKQANLPVLAYLAIGSKDWILSLGGPFIAMLAIMSSYIGFYIGSSDGLVGLWNALFAREAEHDEKYRRKVYRGVYVFIAVSAWCAAFFNWDIGTLINDITGPTTALILFLFPVYAYYRIPSLSRFKKQHIRNIILILLGFAIASVAVLDIFN